MADIEKMREIFEEVLKEFESSEHICIGENGYPGDEEKLDSRIAEFRARFNEAVMANQNPTFITVNNPVISEDYLTERIKKIVTEQLQERDRRLKLANAS